LPVYLFIYLFIYIIFFVLFSLPVSFSYVQSFVFGDLVLGCRGDVDDAFSEPKQRPIIGDSPGSIARLCRT